MLSEVDCEDLAADLQRVVTRGEIKPELGTEAVLKDSVGMGASLPELRGAVSR